MLVPLPSHYPSRSSVCLLTVGPAGFGSHLSVSSVIEAGGSSAGLSHPCSSGVSCLKHVLCLALGLQGCCLLCRLVQETDCLPPLAP